MSKVKLFFDNKRKEIWNFFIDVFYDLDDEKSTIIESLLILLSVIVFICVLVTLVYLFPVILTVGGIIGYTCAIIIFIYWIYTNIKMAFQHEKYNVTIIKIPFIYKLLGNNSILIKIAADMTHRNIPETVKYLKECGARINTTNETHINISVNGNRIKFIKLINKELVRISDLVK